MESGALVAIFCNSFPPEGGGAANRIYNLASLLVKAGYRVQVVAAMPNYPKGKIFPDYRGKLTVNEVIDGIQVRRVWLWPSNTASALSRGWSQASFILSLKLLAFGHVARQKPSLVIVSSPPLPMAAAAMRYFKNKGTKLLLNVSDIWPLSAKALGALERGNLYRQLELAAGRMYAAADAISAQSDETLAHIGTRVKKMPPAFTYRNLPALAAQEAGGLVPYSGDLKIIYPGLLGHAQGLLALCQAIDFRSLGAELHIYGDGPEKAAITSFLKAQPQRSIYIHEPVAPEELPKILAGFHAMLIPLAAPIEGALPSKLFTAMQTGMPVIYSGGGEGEQIVRDFHLGWTAAPGDFTAIGGAVRRLSAMTEAAFAEWQFAIRKTADEHFNKEQQDRKMLAFVRSIIGQ